MNSAPLIVSYDGSPYSVIRRQEDWGVESYDLAAPPRRFWADLQRLEPAVKLNVDARRVEPILTPAQLLDLPSQDDSWQALSRRSVARLWAHYLLCEDPQRRMDARKVATLSHQVSVVHHILGQDHLRRVLLADEVGLGKTVEIGLLLVELFRVNPGTRVLYLSPARLVDNVAREFDRLNLGFRRWKAVDSDGKLSDPRIIASIHRAAFPNNLDNVIKTEPWDVIVVDECHHLSDWAAGGGDPVNKYRLVRELACRQASNGRLILLSGTPHQGNPIKFENLLRLLQATSEGQDAVRGRVIYRTKEDIKDWRGKPVFPPRQVNAPVVVTLGTEYRRWLEQISQFYRPPVGSALGNARQRAAGWRCAQALQWAASSPQAGLGFLVRQAIRSNWTLKNQALAAAVMLLRPYRDGPPEEELEGLFARISREVIRQETGNDIEDIEDEIAADLEQSKAERAAMEDLLREGVRVLEEAGDQKWRILKKVILDQANGEKVVLFAQPIETVNALALYLEKVTGERPSIIVGGQTDIERQDQENRFRKATGPQFLVSSRAGGEGINLQVAHRLVHIDVPWNPMELEQRVGRIHRFGSRKTIIVDMLVVGGSREADAYRIARLKLREIAAVLRPDFEMLFARVMALVSPEELQGIVIKGPFVPLSPEDAARLATVVQSGFRAWSEFNEKFKSEQERIKTLDAGLVSWKDIEDFVVRYAGAKAVEGFRTEVFESFNADADLKEEAVRAFRFRNGNVYAIGDTQGAPIFGPDDQTVQPLGLNSEIAASVLRECAFPKAAVGAAHLKLGPGWRPSGTAKNGSTGVLVFLVQQVQSQEQTGWQELSSFLCCYEVGPKSARIVDGLEKRDLLGALLHSAVRARPPSDDMLVAAVVKTEIELYQVLRRPSDEQIAAGVRHAVTPLLAAIVSFDGPLALIEHPQAMVESPSIVYAESGLSQEDAVTILADS